MSSFDAGGMRANIWTSPPCRRRQYPRHHHMCKINTLVRFPSTQSGGTTHATALMYYTGGRSVYQQRPVGWKVRCSCICTCRGYSFLFLSVSCWSTRTPTSKATLRAISYLTICTSLLGLDHGGGGLFSLGHTRTDTKLAWPWSMQAPFSGMLDDTRHTHSWSLLLSSWRRWCCGHLHPLPETLIWKRNIPGLSQLVRPNAMSNASMI